MLKSGERTDYSSSPIKETTCSENIYLSISFYRTMGSVHFSSILFEPQLTQS